MDKKTAENILLGYGIVEIDGVPVGLTRGGSSFSVEREFRNIEADGDKGTVKGRVVMDSESPILKVNALEMFSKEEIMKAYPALKLEGEMIESDFTIKVSDYHKVVWKGKTLNGSPILITLENGINKENIEFTMEDKNEVVPELTFTGSYEEGSRSKSAFSINFGKEEV